MDGNGNGYIAMVHVDGTGHGYHEGACGWDWPRATLKDE